MKYHYTYAICRLDSKYWKSIHKDLLDRGYSNIRPVIPVVKIPKRTKKGQNSYDEVPYLFNYGFIKMTTEKAFDRQFLRRVKQDIPGILGWLQDTSSMHPRKQRKRIDNAEDFDDFSKVATVSREQVRYYKRLSKTSCIYSKDDILNIHIGSYIVLHGYPFEGMGAEVVDINFNTKMISLSLIMERGSLNIQLPIDQVAYSIYNDFDEDNLLTKEDVVDINSIPEEVI